jgi:Skp family chaperone for outer membrane proteins
MKRLILLSAILSTLSFAQQKFACIDTNRIPSGIGDCQKGSK